ADTRDDLSLIEKAEAAGPRAQGSAGEGEVALSPLICPIQHTVILPVLRFQRMQMKTGVGKAWRAVSIQQAANVIRVA
ncbi:hypothetical protein QP669_25940, partial [Escherichia coli]|nr:hypothetical protein [Escherichia coli]